MQFKVPQDVQREDTIIGPLTLRKMIILGVGGAIAYAIYATLSKGYKIGFWLPPVTIVSLFTLAFAFLKIHNLEFHQFLMNLLEYKILPDKRIWIQGTDRPQKPLGEAKKVETKITNTLAKPTKSLEEIGKILDKQNQN